MFRGTCTVCWGTWPPPSLTFMSLMCRYSSMIALDFFSSSSSDSAGLVDVAGGVGSCLTAIKG